MGNSPVSRKCISNVVCFLYNHNGTAWDAGCAARLPGARSNPCGTLGRNVVQPNPRIKSYLMDSEYMEQNSWTRTFRASRSSLKYKGLNMRSFMASRGVMGLPYSFILVNNHDTCSTNGAPVVVASGGGILFRRYGQRRIALIVMKLLQLLRPEYCYIVFLHDLSIIG